MENRIDVTDRASVLASPSAHNLTKDVLKLSEKKNIVDRYYDVLMALKVLKSEMDSALNQAGNVSIRLLSLVSMSTLLICFAISAFIAKN